MSGSKWMLGAAALVVAAAMVTPSYAGKKVITDNEMDNVTAAGQPIVLSTGSESGIDQRDETNLALGIEDNAQSDLRALVLNNTAGENQVGTGLNIASGGSTGRQDNNITQSWGSTYDRFVQVGASATATATASADGGNATCSTRALICKPVGGNGSASASASASTQPSVRASIYSDQILLAEEGDVFYRPQTSIALDVQDTAQIGLSALVVNNVSGLNQVANGVNISGSVGTGPVGAGNVSVTSASASTGQGNITNQFRGTPFSRPQ